MHFEQHAHLRRRKFVLGSAIKMSGCSGWHGCCNLLGNSAQNSWRKKLHWLQWKYGAETAWVHALQFSLRLSSVMRGSLSSLIMLSTKTNGWSWLMWATSEAFLYFPCSLMCLMKSSRGSTDWSANGNLISFVQHFRIRPLLIHSPWNKKIINEMPSKKKVH